MIMSRLFEPLAVGTTRLGHRVAMAPLTRYRMDDEFKATPMSKGTLANQAHYAKNTTTNSTVQSTMSNEHVFQARSL
jgi:2,4-dienoyl-CoA reductase-like NADH-dependent reductase (Old Yellow Enzyme family)